MPYATYQDIEARLDTDGVGFNPPTHKVTQAECEGFIADFSYTVDGILKAQGYPTVPATGMNDVGMLRMYIANKTAAHVWMIIFVGDTLSDNIKTWNEDWNNFINRLRQGQQFLVDQSPTSTTGGQIVIGAMTMRGSQWTQSDVENYETDFDLP